MERSSYCTKQIIEYPKEVTFNMVRNAELLYQKATMSTTMDKIDYWLDYINLRAIYRRNLNQKQIEK